MPRVKILSVHPYDHDNSVQKDVDFPMQEVSEEDLVALKWYVAHKNKGYTKPRLALIVDCTPTPEELKRISQEYLEDAKRQFKAAEKRKKTNEEKNKKRLATLEKNKKAKELKLLNSLKEKYEA